MSARTMLSRILICFLVFAWSPAVLASQPYCATGGDAPIKLRVAVLESQRQPFIDFLQKRERSLAFGAQYGGGVESDTHVDVIFQEFLDRETDSSIAIIASHERTSLEFDFIVKTCNTDRSWRAYLGAMKSSVLEFGNVEMTELPTVEALDMMDRVFPDTPAAEKRATAELAMDLANIFAWRLAPESIQEWCRDADPEGNNARADALATWRRENSALISAVDTRVAEVVPLMKPSLPTNRAVKTVLDQVNSRLRGYLFAGKDVEELQDECRDLTRPGNELWSNSRNGVVQLSLASLQEWQSANRNTATTLVDLKAWAAAAAMGTGVNIGNTLENTTHWETGWGNPRITRELIGSLKAMGFSTVRVPVAWDTFAKDGQVQPDKMARVAEVADWITAAGMYCVINIHWDGGWIDSSNKEKFAKTHATFSADAERKFISYWTQIANHFKDRNHLLVFEGLNEETNFEGTGSMKQAYETLTNVNQLFIDTVRQTGGNNAKRLLIVTGYGTDITKTTSKDFVLPVDSLPDRLMLSVHYYTPWQFAGMTKDESWGKVQHTWGSAADVAELNRLFDAMQEFSRRNDIPVFVGEFGVTDQKEKASRVRWMSAVAKAALSRKMVPVLWDTGGDVSRKPPYGPSEALREAMKQVSSGK